MDRKEKEEMNKVILMGRLTRDAEVRYSKGNEPMAIARYTLAVDRRRVQDGQQSADFISCVSFGKDGEFMEKYGKKGQKFLIEGRIQTGSYTNKDGQKVYTTDVVTENIEFAESRGNSQQQNNEPQDSYSADGFMNIPDGIDDEIPFN